MDVQVFTIRDLDEARRRGRLRRREEQQGELRNTAFVLALFALVWTLREICLRGWL